MAPAAAGDSSETAAPVAVTDETQAPVVAVDETASPVVESSETLAPVVVDETQAPVVESSETLQPAADETAQPAIVSNNSLDVPTIAPSVEISPVTAPVFISPASPALTPSDFEFVSPAFSPAESPVESPTVGTLAPVAGAAAALSIETLTAPEKGQDRDAVVDLSPEPQVGVFYKREHFFSVRRARGSSKRRFYTPFPSAAPP